jgi:CDP-glycerol glycerophosphotransferase
MFFCNKFFGIKNKIVFISFNGKSYSDNPRAISEILHEMSSDVEIVWLFNSPESKKEITPEYIRLVSNRGFKKLYELSTA